MSGNSHAPAQQPPASQAHSVQQGTPVTIATTVQPQPPQTTQPSPYSFEFWTPILLFAMLVSGALALFSKGISDKVSEFEKIHKPIHDQIDKTFHRLANEASSDRARIHTLETFRQSDVERIVKLETQFHSIEKSQERVEKAIDKMGEDLADRIDGWAEQFSASIREVRDVKPRS